MKMKLTVLASGSEVYLKMSPHPLIHALKTLSSGHQILNNPVEVVGEKHVLGIVKNFLDVDRGGREREHGFFKDFLELFAWAKTHLPNIDMILQYGRDTKRSRSDGGGN